MYSISVENRSYRRFVESVTWTTVYPGQTVSISVPNADTVLANVNQWNGLLGFIAVIATVTGGSGGGSGSSGGIQSINGEPPDASGNVVISTGDVVDDASPTFLSTYSAAKA